MRGGLSLARRITAAIEPRTENSAGKGTGPIAHQAIARLRTAERTRLLARYAERMAEKPGG